MYTTILYFEEPSSQNGDSRSSGATAQEFDIEDGFKMSMREVSGLFPTEYHVLRGVEVEETEKDRQRLKEVDHLCLVLHGIGETMFKKKEIVGVKCFQEVILHCTLDTLFFRFLHSHKCVFLNL